MTVGVRRTKCGDGDINVTEVSILRTSNIFQVSVISPHLTYPVLIRTRPDHDFSKLSSIPVSFLHLSPYLSLFFLISLLILNPTDPETLENLCLFLTFHRSNSGSKVVVHCLHSISSPCKITLSLV